MAGFLSWLQQNWTSIVSAVGIIGSLWFTGASFNNDSKTRQLSNLLALIERHRVLWSEAHQRPDLKRIFSNDADVLTQPPSVAEEEFLRLAIIHFETGWKFEKDSNTSDLNALATDAADFFSRPLPRAVWEKTKQYRNPKFVRFVVRALEGRGH